MDVPGSAEHCVIIADLDRRDATCGFEFRQHLAQAWVAAAYEVLGDAAFVRHAESTQGLLGGATHNLLIGKGLAWRPFWQTALRQIPQPLSAHAPCDQNLSLRPEEVQHPVDIAFGRPAGRLPSPPS